MGAGASERAFMIPGWLMAGGVASWREGNDGGACACLTRRLRGGKRHLEEDWQRVARVGHISGRLFY